MIAGLVSADPLALRMFILCKVDSLPHDVLTILNQIWSIWNIGLEEA